MLKNNTEIFERSDFVATVESDTLKICINGEIDHHSAVATRTEIDAIIFRNRPKILEMDLSNVGFMDSSGLGLIMGRYSLMNELGGSMVVVDPSLGVERIMRLAGLEKVIRIEKRKRVSK